MSAFARRRSRRSTISQLRRRPIWRAFMVLTRSLAPGSARSWSGVASIRMSWWRDGSVGCQNRHQHRLGRLIAVARSMPRSREEPLDLEREVVQVWRGVHRLCSPRRLFGQAPPVSWRAVGATLG